MRVEYEMTEADLEKLLWACRPVPYIAVSGGVEMSYSQQENANGAWIELGNRMGFDGMTVKPVPGKDQRFFTAERKEQK